MIANHKQPGVAFWGTVGLVVVLFGFEPGCSKEVADKNRDECAQLLALQAERARNAVPGSQGFAEIKAIDEVVRRTGRQRSQLIVISDSEKIDGQWRVLIAACPMSHGSHWSLHISDRGEVLQYDLGE